MNAVIIALSLAAGNFVYQMLFGGPDWAVAIERSFFQILAIGTYVLVSNGMD